jgi:large subunit ribosomal protein L30
LEKNKKTSLQTSNRQTAQRRNLQVGQKLKITQIRSTIGRIKKQKETIKALGIRKLYQSVIHEDTPQIRGMIEKVKHLVEVEEI